MHKSQILFYLLLAFICGVFVASFLAISETWILVFLIFAIGLITISGYRKTYSKNGLFAGALFFVFIFGIIRFNSFNLANSILNQFADIEVGGKGVVVTLTGYVDEEPDVNGDKSQIVFKVKELIVPDKTLVVDERTLIYTNAFPRYKFGDNLSVIGALKSPQNFVEDFDYVSYLKKQNIRTVVSFPKVTEINDLDTGFFEKTKIGLYKKIFGLKNKFESAINKSISEPNASFINGILLGSRQNIPEEIKEAFNKTGTTHILAISGYNIMIISWAVLSLLVYFFKRRTAFWLSVAIIILFTILTGASSSVVRASIMGLLLLFANGYGRLYDPKNSIILAGVAMIWSNPFALVFDIGFQLSFVAVIGLMYLYPRIDSKLKKLPKLGNLKEMFLMTLSAQIAVAPLLIYYFKNFSLVSLLANILILPFLPAAMFIGFISGLAGVIFLPVGQVVGFIAWAITTYQIKIIEFLASI
ncbi:MAG: hypothetical protein A3I26_00980 [Candidatus Yanofskybacteria bacterium RIFCSPLOWO2_02_FULL_43_10]|uniref:ComEC/Rec2-related protein domain-containing protein n=1 Tax=Candidatus Yanofskybacteria bacterium RIFCSPLOWO2_12_FULL_43_11b TaxID=1802710 RepID=A0A1F8H9T2_9BACT|nr:MAG: hypothetical protein A2742_03530 [Candidatus Yanofskybacteria bacterium RIFCSPHIGHO2_01_FULL_43_32]OGN12119.1 MAG: hypothetical protein A3C69_02105 [Candidatus Yanofskybacteria bacterium RIFCSPHIGHO2_02_FULL_43_12]OGN18272.1 MAG: hypothetical protein A3E34_02590 [Candidatus Yanofskybacteria bacterium RIFCSPHIGHO2_12_FULL_43_11]OGN25233.1 MAG: hypothetical protein A2923_00655 [Candidatus Yanofskybacteria bacterium RIFCSPLOWO2_01_FULL_43_46]OGN30357.1 MAG: hypothetical protein A3I26_00980